VSGATSEVGRPLLKPGRFRTCRPRSTFGVSAADEAIDKVEAVLEDAVMAATSARES